MLNGNDEEAYVDGLIVRRPSVSAYEMYAQMGEGRVSGFNSRLISVDERRRLGDELVAARRSMDVLRPGRGPGSARGNGNGDGDGDGDGSAGDGSAGDGDGGGRGGGGAEGGESSGGGGGGGEDVSDEDRLLDEKEARAIASVLNAGPIATKDAAALFFLARRTQSFAPFSGINEAVLAAAAELYDEEAGDGDVAKNNAPLLPPPPSVKKLSNRIRQKLGVSLTVRELERVLAQTVERRTGRDDAGTSAR